MLTFRPYFYAAALAAVTALGAWLWGVGYAAGKRACEASHAAAEAAQAEAAAKLDAARIEIQRQRDALARQLQEAAYADPVSVPECLGAGRVRRLNSLR